MPTDRVTVTPVRVERNRTSGVSPVPAPHLSWTVTTSEPLIGQPLTIEVTAGPNEDVGVARGASARPRSRW